MSYFFLFDWYKMACCDYANYIANSVLPLLVFAKVQAMKKFTEGNAMQILDPNLSPNPATTLAVEQIFELVLRCLAPTRHKRPSMRRCAKILWSIRKDYRELLFSDSFSQPSDQRNAIPNRKKEEELMG